jgi:hypothetical protein
MFRDVVVVEDGRILFFLVRMVVVVWVWVRPGNTKAEDVVHGVVAVARNNKRRQQCLCFPPLPFLLVVMVMT